MLKFDNLRSRQQKFSQSKKLKAIQKNRQLKRTKATMTMTPTKTQMKILMKIPMTREMTRQIFSQKIKKKMMSTMMKKRIMKTLRDRTLTDLKHNGMIFLFQLEIRLNLKPAGLTFHNVQKSCTVAELLDLLRRRTNLATSGQSRSRKLDSYSSKFLDGQITRLLKTIFQI